MKKYGVLLGMIVLLAFFITSGCRPPGEPVVPEEEPLVEDIEAVETHQVGQRVTVGDIVWEITEVEDLGTELIHEDVTVALEPRLGKFVEVAFFVQNVGEEAKTVFDLTLIDDQGRTYQICLEAFAFFVPEEACVLQEIIPGVENNYFGVFDVEIDVETLTLEVTDLEIPPGEVAYIDLGI